MATVLGAHGGIATTIGLLQGELPELQEQQHTLEKELAAVTERLEAVRTALSSLQALSAGSVSRDTAPAAAPEREVTEAPAGPEAIESEQPAAGTAPAAAGEETATAETAEEKPGRAARAARTSAAKKIAGAGRAKRTGTRAAKKTAAGTRKAAAKTGKAAEKTTEKTTAKTTAKTEKAAKSQKRAVPAKRTAGLTEGVVECLTKAAGPLRAADVNDALGRENTSGNVNSVRNTLERLAAASRIQRAGRGLYQVSAS